MRFWRKFWSLFIFCLILLLLQFSAPEIGHLNFNMADREFSIGIYAILSLWVSAWLVCFSIKSFFVWFLNLFFKNRTAEESRSIQGLAKLILDNDSNFQKDFEKTFTTDSMNVIKTALAIKRGLNISTFEKTGLHCIDIYLIKTELAKHLKNVNTNAAIELANKAIKNYYENIEVISDELLALAKLAKKSDIKFSFDPSKFKYNLSQQFIEEYNCSLALVDFESESNFDKKLKIIENLRKNYSANIDITKTYLDFAFDNNIDEKKILNAIKDSLSVNPNREIAPYLLKLNRKDIFELTQSYLSNIGDKNIEKLWILLIISTQLQYIHIAEDLIYKILELGELDELCRFYITHYSELSKDESIILAINKRLDNGNKI